MFYEGIQLDEKKKEPLYEQLYRAFGQPLKKGGWPRAAVCRLFAGGRKTGVSAAPRWKKRTSSCA